jgi:beta-phosphoglucomutase-like phosphatase (HAD superfamily)
MSHLQPFVDERIAPHSPYAALAPADCIVYEDSDLGLTAAERAGMRWIDVRILGEKS